MALEAVLSPPKVILKTMSNWINRYDKCRPSKWARYCHYREALQDIRTKRHHCICMSLYLHLESRFVSITEVPYVYIELLHFRPKNKSMDQLWWSDDWFGNRIRIHVLKLCAIRSRQDKLKWWHKLQLYFTL